jgi:hypothetical protein
MSIRTTIDSADARTHRALVIAADSGDWARVTDRRSGVFYSAFLRAGASPSATRARGQRPYLLRREVRPPGRVQAPPCR